MPFPSSHSAFGRLTAFLLLCVVCVGAPDASAQSLFGPQYPASASQQVSCQTGACTTAVTPACQTCCPAEGYWIISLRCCPQKKRGVMCSCCPQFYFRTPDDCLHPSNHASFLASLIPRVPICLMVHGSYVKWQDVQIDAQQTFCWIRGAAPQLPLNYVYITWPSDPHFPPFDIQALGRKSARNGFHLARIIQTIPCDHPISFIGHSHGARMTLSTLHLLGGGEVQGYALQCATGASHRFRVVMAAAAIDHDWMNPGERYGCALPITECVLSMRTRKDRALAIYPMRHPFCPASLGRKGFTRRDLRKMGSCACRVAEVDATPYVGNHHFWQFYNRHAALAQSTVPYVYFPDVQMQPVEVQSPAP